MRPVLTVLATIAVALAAAAAAAAWMIAMPGESWTGPLEPISPAERESAERLCDRLKIIDQGATLAEGAPRALIAEHIEPEVVEVYGENAGEWFAAHGKALALRAELHGETAFCYTRDPAPLIANLREQASLRFMHRRANLEDVFLKLTGREMRE